MYGTTRAGDGWRARIGVVIPSVNVTVEAWFPRVVPEGVTIHTARMPIAADVTPESIEEMARHELAAVKLVADCEPDVILYACTASTLLRGRDADLALMAELTEATGVPCCTTTEAIVRACRELGMRKVCVASPYTKEVDDLERVFLAECGMEISGVTSFEISDGRELADPSPGEVYRHCRDAWVPGSDGLLATCLAMRSHQVAAELETDLGVPVVTSAQATLWAGLRMAGVMTPLTGHGRLLQLAGSGWADAPAPTL